MQYRSHVLAVAPIERTISDRTLVEALSNEFDTGEAEAIALLTQQPLFLHSRTLTPLSTRPIVG